MNMLVNYAAGGKNLNSINIRVKKCPGTEKNVK